MLSGDLNSGRTKARTGSVLTEPQLRKMFAMYDSNKNGVVDLADLFEGLKAFGWDDVNAVHSLFANLVDYDEGKPSLLVIYSLHSPSLPHA